MISPKEMSSVYFHSMYYLLSYVDSTAWLDFENCHTEQCRIVKNYDKFSHI